MREITLQPGTRIEIDGVTVRSEEPSGRAVGSEATDVNRLSIAGDTELLDALRGLRIDQQTILEQLESLKGLREEMAGQCRSIHYPGV